VQDKTKRQFSPEIIRFDELGSHIGLLQAGRLLLLSSCGRIYRAMGIAGGTKTLCAAWKNKPVGAPAHDARFSSAD